MPVERKLFVCLVAIIAAVVVGCRGRATRVKPTKGFGMMFNFPPVEGTPAPVPPPGYFVRAASSLSEPDAKIEIPRGVDTILYESELAIVIGTRARRVSEAGAAACIAGYTCGMDGSPLILDANGERDAARSIAGKSFDGVAPVGTQLVTKLAPGGHEVVLRVNGEEVDRSNTRDLIWQPERIVSEISQKVTLEPGDVIFCGANKAVPKMRPGDVVEVEISGIGVMRNEVVAAP